MLGALMLPVSAMVIGLVVTIEASTTLLALQQGGISASTPVGGITVGLIAVGGFAALVAAVKGAHSIILFTLSCGRWVQTMNETVGKVQTHEKELAALQRWREHIVDPLLTRDGIGKPNPLNETQRLIIDEAAG